MAITTPQGIDLQAPEALELKTVQPNIAARDNISLVTRYIGLKVFVQDTGLNYQLKGGVTNANWVQFGDALSYDDFYTKVNMQTSGEAELHWDNLTAVPSSFPPSAHTHVEADITNLQPYLLDITGQLIGSLSDVVLTSPQPGDYLTLSGGNWINTSASSLTVNWGNITGTLSTQLDLQNELNNKKNNFTENTGFNKDFGTAYTNVARGDHNHTILTGLEYLVFSPQSPALPYQEGLMYYDSTDHTWRLLNDITDVALDVGEELWGRVTNVNAYTLPNGKVGYVRGSVGLNLDCDLLDASIIGHGERALGLFTNDIATGADGYITRFGVVRGIDTSAWAIDDLLYADPHNPGEMTNVKPSAPHYPIRIGIVLFSDVSNGTVGVDTLAFTGSDTSVAADGIIDGVVIFTPQVDISVSGGIIYADVTNETDPTHDLPFIINGVRYNLNTTTNTGPGGAARIIIPPGADASTAQVSRLYIRLNAGTPELAITTGAFSEPYANIATFAVFNATRTLSDGKPLMYRRANNAVSSQDIGIDGSFGLVTVLANAMRFKLGSNWLLGQDATETINDTTIRVAMTSGLGAQLHASSLPAFDGLNYLIYNDTSNTATYAASTNLTDIVTDASGNTLLADNTHYTIRLFYQLNSNGVGDNVIATRPLAAYTTSAEAIQDPLNYTTNINDTSIEEVIYPLYDIVISRSGVGGTTIALTQLTDLRKKIATGLGGGGASGGGGTDDKVRTSASDTVNDYLFSKLEEGDNITLEITNPGGVEKVKISAGGGYKTVGTGGDYATVQLALADSQYDLKLISNVTETVNWGAHSERIKIFSDDFYTISLSVSNTSDVDFEARYIQFNVTSTNLIFTSTSYIYLDSCTIVGDSSHNDFRGHVDGRNLSIDVGTNGFRIYLYNVIGLNVTGTIPASAEAIQVGILGNVSNITLTGDFGLGLSSYDGSVIDGVTGDNQSGIIMRGESAIYNARDIRIYSREDNASTLVNCNLDSLYNYSSAYKAYRLIDNCIIGELLTPFSGGNVDTLYGATSVINTEFTHSDVHILDDNITLQNCKVSNGTIITDATADKTTIIGCRTGTSIEDNGTNTTLLANNLI